MSDELDDLKWMMEQLVEKAYSKGWDRAISVLRGIYDRTEGKIDIMDLIERMAEGKEDE